MVIVGLCYSQDPTPGNEICYIIIIYIILFIYLFIIVLFSEDYIIQYKLLTKTKIRILFIYRFPVKHAIECYSFI